MDPIADTDIQGFLKNEKENSILSVIGEVHKSVSILSENYLSLSAIDVPISLKTIFFSHLNQPKIINGNIL